MGPYIDHECATSYQSAAQQSAQYSQECLDENDLRNACKWQEQAAMFSKYDRLERRLPG